MQRMSIQTKRNSQRQSTSKDVCIKIPRMDPFYQFRKTIKKKFSLVKNQNLEDQKKAISSLKTKLKQGKNLTSRFKLYGTNQKNIKNHCDHQKTSRKILNSSISFDKIKKLSFLKNQKKKCKFPKLYSVVKAETKLKQK